MSLVPKFSVTRFLETAVVVVVILIALDMFPQLRFWSGWRKPGVTA